jgi:hypothetical protein
MAVVYAVRLNNEPRLFSCRRFMGGFVGRGRDFGNHVQASKRISETLKGYSHALACARFLSISYETSISAVNLLIDSICEA